jgi:hypothetical protein
MKMNKLYNETFFEQRILEKIKEEDQEAYEIAALITQSIKDKHSFEATFETVRMKLRSKYKEA